MSHVDDYGTAEAIPGILRCVLYPLRIDRVKDTHIEQWLAECSKAGLVGLYESGTKKYLQILNFGQQLRSKNKHPLPTPEQLQAAVNGCLQPLTSVHLGVCEDVVGDGVVCAPQGGQPKDLPELIAYAKEIGLPESEAEACFFHFEANGWRQGGRTRLRSWRAAVQGWKRNMAKFGKNSAVSGAAAERDWETPSQAAIDKMIAK